MCILCPKTVQFFSFLSCFLIFLVKNISTRWGMAHIPLFLVENSGHEFQMGKMNPSPLPSTLFLWKQVSHMNTKYILSIKKQNCIFPSQYFLTQQQPSHWFSLISLRNIIKTHHSKVLLWSRFPWTSFACWHDNLIIFFKHQPWYILLPLSFYHLHFNLFCGLFRDFWWGFSHIFPPSGFSLFFLSKLRFRACRCVFLTFSKTTIFF